MAGAADNWRDETRSAWLYRVLAAAERNPRIAHMFAQLAEAAEAQAAIWARAAGRDGAPPERFRPDLRARLVAALVRRVGPRRLRHVLAALKVRGLSAYSGKATGHAMPVTLADVGARHAGAGKGGNLRAAVFGVNDGLVSNTSLILGIAGATAQTEVILLTGVAGLLAGAFSMAAGEYVSVRSQRELFEYQIGLERAELALYPKEEAAELALIYAARGIPRPQAQELAERIVGDPERALDTLAREELGLDPDELGSPVGAAVFSFASFAVGAAIPLAPWVIVRGGGALLAATVLAGSALFAVGAALSLFTGRNAAWGGLRMLLLGGAAAAATFGIGRLLGVSVG
jgi:VIT1/CCC1 family predicted Fe2+/Mn2+ transporter